MPRKARKDIKTQFVHFMIQGVNKEFIFNSEKYIKKYLELINKEIEDKDLDILAYCMMNNHAHFLIHFKDVRILSDVIKNVNCKYVQMYNKLENRCGVLFRNRFKTEPIYDRKYLINCMKYIHNNPVKAGIVARCEDYPYSSYNDYINHTGLSKSCVIEELFGKDCNFYQIFKQTIDIRFMEVEDEDNNFKEYMEGSIYDYVKDRSIELYRIFSERIILKNLINVLKEKYHFKYVEVMQYFGISKATMESIKL